MKAAYCVILGAALLRTVAADAAPLTPPPEWAKYFADVRSADAIEDAEARCLTFPDPPGNHWLPGAAQGRCSILRKAMLSLDEIDRMLTSPDGVAELDRRYGALLDAHFNDPTQREQIYLSLEAFDGKQRSAEVSQRWLKLAPKSVYANAAVGGHHANAGWLARGTEYAANTSKSRLDAMGEQFALAIPPLLQAFKQEPRLGFACHALAGIGRQSSDNLQRWALGQCLEADPDSYMIALELVASARPRWGGSPDAMRAAVAYARARVGRNPAMGALLSEGAEEAAPSLAEDKEHRLELMRAALMQAPSGLLSNQVAYAYEKIGDPWASAAFYAQAARFLPNGDEDHMNFAVALHRLGDLEWASKHQIKAVELKPEQSSYQYYAGRYLAQQGKYKQAQPHFKSAMKDPEWQMAASRELCRTLLAEGDAPAARLCSQRLTSDYPDSSGIWLLRSHVLYLDKHPDALAAMDRFFALAGPDTADATQVSEVKKWRSDLQTELDRTTKGR